jgi:hypothetical protein
MNRFDLTTPDGTPAQRRTYHNADSVVQGEQRRVYPTEFLNSLNMSGVPPHTLTLQEGYPVILLRNMSGSLANGTHLIVVKLIIVTLALGSRPRQRGCKGVGQREARESHQGLPGV